MPEETVRAMLARQAGRNERLAIADYAVTNDQGPQALASAIARLHDRLLRDLAAAEAHANQT
jgi:dephospho-CoA kinase